jgi:flagellar hook capping protein FlgD
MSAPPGARAPADAAPAGGPDRPGRPLTVALLLMFVVAFVIFALPFAFTTQAPLVTRFRASGIFSPNLDHHGDRALVRVRLHDPSLVTLEVRGRDGDHALVRTLRADRPTKRGWLRLSWDGRDDRGARVPDGAYALNLRARSASAKKLPWRASRVIVVDTTPPTIRSLAVRPASAGAGGAECRLTVVAAERSTLRVRAMGDSGAAIEAGPLRLEAGRPFRWRWDGSDSRGRPVPAGPYRLRIALTDPVGNRRTEVRTCWVGHLVGAAVPARPAAGQEVGVLLRSPGGAAVPAGTPAHLALYRRLGTPGRAASFALGTPVGTAASGPAGQVRLRLPAATDPSGLWLVASTNQGQALIALGPPVP